MSPRTAQPLARARRSSRWFVWPLAGAAVVAACGGGNDGGTTPGGQPSAIAIVSGNGQTDTVGTPLTDTLIVRLTNQQSNPVGGQLVVFSRIAGGTGGSLIPDTAISDADGQARSRWVLGHVAGPQRVQAKVLSNQVLTANFDATALAGPADTLLSFGGDGQAGPTNAALPESLAVVVTDQFGNPVAGRQVLWATVGGGTVSPDTTVSGPDGHAATRRVLGSIAGVQQATATAAGLKGSPVSFSDTAVATATSIVKIVGDGQGGVVNTALTAPIVIRVDDAQGNPVAGKSYSFVVTPANGSVAPRSGLTDSLGEASTVWTLGPRAGIDTLTVLVPGVGQVLFTAIAAAGAADSMAALSVLTQNGTAGQAVSARPSVRVLDAGRNLVPGATVTFTVTAGGGSVTSGATSGATVNVLTDTAGVATLTAWTLGATAGANGVEASATGPGGSLKNSPISFSATGATGSAARLKISTEPTAAVANGDVLPQQPAVQLQDAGGNPVSVAGRQITLSLGGAGATLRGTRTVSTGSNGVAAFAGLSLFGTAGTYTLVATAAGLVPDTTIVVTLTPGAAARLGIKVQPSSQAASGAVFAQQPQLQVQDSSGNAVPQGSVDVTAALATGTGTVGGTTLVTSASNGAVSFTDLSIAGAAGNRTLAFTSPGFIGVNSSAIQIGAGAPTTLALATLPPPTARSGIALVPQPTVQLQDASGANVAKSGVPVTLVVSAGGTLRGVTTVTTNAAGLASFGGIAISGAAASYTLTVTSPGLAPDVSGAISLSAGLPATLTIATQPSASGQSGIALAQQPVLQVRDDAGNALAQAGITVAASVLSGPGGTLRGQSSIQTDVNGTAVFTNLNLFGALGGYTLKFDGGAGGGLTAVNANGITLAAGPAARLQLATAPSASAQNGVAFPQQPVVQLIDSSGNPVSQAGVQVTAAIATGAPALAGTLNANTGAGGSASFSGLRIAGALGNRTLSFLANGLPSIASPVIAVGTGPARTIALNGGNGQSAVAGHAVNVAPSVLVTDTTGNPVAAAAVTFAVIAGGGSVGTASAVTGANGVASAGSWILGTTPGAGSDSLLATAAGLAGSPVRFGATATAAGTGQLAITTQPSLTAQSGAALAQQPVIELRDFSNVLIPTSGVVITATVSSGTLVGTATATTVNGVATFATLGLNGLAGPRTLTFGAPAFVGVTSSTISLGHGVATRVAAVTQPSATARSGITFAQQPVVQVQDASGNAVPTATSVTAVILTGNGTLSGTTTVGTGGTASATFTNLGIAGLTGPHTILFNAAGLASDTSATIALTAGTPAQLSANSAVTQNGTVRRAVNAPPSVLLQDASGNPVSGTAVTFALTAGGGSLNGANQTTNANGIATVATWTLGAAAGSNGLTATAAGSGIAGNPVAFTATAAASGASDIAVSAGNNQTATIGTAVAVPPAVLVTDPQGNPVAGVTVTFAVASGGGSVSGGVVATNTSGIAAPGSWTLGGLAGVNSLTATAPGLGGSPVGFTATATAGAAVTIARSAGDNQTRTVGTAVLVDPAVLVTDVNGNPVSGVPVTFAVATGGGSLTGGSAVTNASGIATVGSWTLGTAAGSNTITATAGGLAGSPVTFTATGVAGAASAGQSTASVPGGAVGLPTTITIQARDQFGNAVTSGGATIVVTVSGANGAAPVVSDLGNGSYVASYTPATPGTDLVTITLGGAGLGGSPFTSLVQ